MPGGSASSFHLFWRLPTAAERAGLVEVSATLEVNVEPQVRALYFWALQVDFVDGHGTWGGGHTGLQWNRRYPDGRAVNWGGYASADRGGAVLPGSASELPGFSDDRNTLSYLWRPKRPYRLRVYRSPDTVGAWRADVTDLQSGEAHVIRDLGPRPGAMGGLGAAIRSLLSGRSRQLVGRETSRGPEAGYLVRPMVWSEVFAECDDPAVEVRWSDLQAVDETGRVWLPEAVSVNYQAGSEGGCSNTDSSPDGKGGIVQTTGSTRLFPQGTSIPLR